MPATTKAKTDTTHKTQNDLPAQKRADVVAILNPRLADTIDLMHQAKQGETLSRCISCSTKSLMRLRSTWI